MDKSTEIKVNTRFSKLCSGKMTVMFGKYFTDELVLKNKFFPIMSEYDKFIAGISKYGSIDNYNEHCNKVENKILDTIRESSQYQEFITDDDFHKHIIDTLSNNRFYMCKIYSEQYVGKKLLSIDMKSANYAVLKKLGVFTDSYIDMMHQFTDDEFLAGSKKFRQSMLGKLNGKLISKYEHHLMVKLANQVFDTLGITPISVLEDEVVYIDDSRIIDVVNDFMNSNNIDLRINEFVLRQLKPIAGYVLETDNKYKLKCINNNYSKLIYRFLAGEEYIENDAVFMQDNMLVKIIDVPKLYIV